MRWLEDWEVFSGFAICPARECIVAGYLPMLCPIGCELATLGTYLLPGGPPPELIALVEAMLPPSPHYLLCRHDVEAAVAKEAEPARKKPTITTEDTESTEAEMQDLAKLIEAVTATGCEVKFTGEMYIEMYVTMPNQEKYAIKFSRTDSTFMGFGLGSVFYSLKRFAFQHLNLIELDDGSFKRKELVANYRDPRDLS